MGSMTQLNTRSKKMINTTFTKTQKLTVSGLAMASYIVILYATQGFSFGAYQIRIATSLYALAYFCPFLVVPLGLANLISNMMFGGLGLLDMIGGCLVGMAATGLIVLIRRKKLNHWFVALPIVIIPGFGVASWLSVLLHMPYLPLVLSLCIGQLIPAVCGVMIIRLTEKYTLKRSIQ